MVVRVDLRNRNASGRYNKIFFSTAGAQLPAPPKPIEQTGQGFKTLSNDPKLSKLNIDTNKKLSKFISFKL
jgi:hypothetical protein